MVSALIKALHRGGASYHHYEDSEGMHQWDLPKDGNPGSWKSYRGGPLGLHFNGIHLAKAEYSVCWVHDENYLARVDGETLEDFEIVVAERACLLRKLEISEDDAADLAFIWAQDVAGLQIEMGYPAEYAQIPVNAVKTYGQWRCRQAGTPLYGDIKQMLAEAGWRSIGYDRDAGRSISYRNNSLASRDICRAVYALGRIQTTEAYVKGKRPVNLPIALEIARLAADAFASACKGITMNTGKPPQIEGERFDNADELYRAVRRKQSHDLCQKFGLID